MEFQALSVSQEGGGIGKTSSFTQVGNIKDRCLKETPEKKNTDLGVNHTETGTEGVGLN